MILLFLTDNLVFVSFLLPFIVVSSTEINKTEFRSTIPYPQVLSQLVKRRHCGKCLVSIANGSICVACMYFSFDLSTQLDARWLGPHHLNALPFLIGFAHFEFVKEHRTGALSKVLSLALGITPFPHFFTPGAFEVTVSNIFHDVDGGCNGVGYCGKIIQVNVERVIDRVNMVHRTGTYRIWYSNI